MVYLLSSPNFIIYITLDSLKYRFCSCKHVLAITTAIMSLKNYYSIKQFYLLIMSNSNNNLKNQVVAVLDHTLYI